MVTLVVSLVRVSIFITTVFIFFVILVLALLLLCSAALCGFWRWFVKHGFFDVLCPVEVLRHAIFIDLG